MCLAIPGSIVDIQDTGATIDMMGVQRTISIALTPQAQVGDYVLVHAGFAIEVIDAEEARQTIELVRELDELTEEDLAENDSLAHEAGADGADGASASGATDAAVTATPGEAETIANASASSCKAPAAASESAAA